MYTFMVQNLRTLKEAILNQIQGKVFVSFTVSTDGTLRDYELVKGVHPSLNAESMRVAKAMNGQWNPALERGEPVQARHDLPISFVNLGVKTIFLDN